VRSAWRTAAGRDDGEERDRGDGRQVGRPRRDAGRSRDRRPRREPDGTLRGRRPLDRPRCRDSKCAELGQRRDEHDRIARAGVPEANEQHAGEQRARCRAAGEREREPALGQAAARQRRAEQEATSGTVKTTGP
jgi:hypothetical protein